jgi:ribonucleotide monophosphatase NagD (HAD superfamily)
LSDTQPEPEVYCFDIDGTLCTNTDGDYDNAEPFPARISKVNALYEQGKTIVLFTARGTTTGKDWRPLTERQMAEWGVKYHKLILGKPFAHVFIDDRAVNDRDWFGDTGR